MAKILVRIAGGVSILFAVAAIISSILMLWVTIQTKEELNDFNNFVEGVLIKASSIASDNFSVLSYEIKGGRNTAIRKDTNSGSKDFERDMENCLGGTMVISSTGIGLGSLQLLLTIIFSCVALLIGVPYLQANRCRAGIWILCNLVCLVSIVILVIVSWIYRYQGCFPSVPCWFAFLLIWTFDLAVAVFFSTVTFLAFQRVGSEDQF